MTVLAILLGLVIVVGALWVWRRRQASPTGSRPNLPKSNLIPPGAKDVTAANRALYRQIYDQVRPIAEELERAHVEKFGIPLANPDRWVPFEELRFLSHPDVLSANGRPGYYLHEQAYTDGRVVPIRAVLMQPHLERAEGFLRHEIAHSQVGGDHQHPIFADPRMAG